MCNGCRFLAEGAEMDLGPAMAAMCWRASRDKGGRACSCKSRRYTRHLVFLFLSAGSSAWFIPRTCTSRLGLTYSISLTVKLHHIKCMSSAWFIPSTCTQQLGLIDGISLRVSTLSHELHGKSSGMVLPCTATASLRKHSWVISVDNSGNCLCITKRVHLRLPCADVQVCRLLPNMHLTAHNQRTSAVQNASSMHVHELLVSLDLTCAARKGQNK